MWAVWHHYTVIMMEKFMQTLTVSFICISKTVYSFTIWFFALLIFLLNDDKLLKISQTLHQYWYLFSVKFISWSVVVSVDVWSSFYWCCVFMFFDNWKHLYINYCANCRLTNYFYRQILTFWMLIIVCIFYKLQQSKIIFFRKLWVFETI